MSFKLNKIKSFFSEHGTWAAVILYAVITIGMTFPVILHMGSEVPKVGSDTWQAIGQIKDQMHTLQTQGIIHGLVKIAKSFQLDVFTPYALLALAANIFIAYNFLFLASFVLSALGAFMLAKYFTGNWRASFFAGLVFAFAPFHFYQALATHMGTMHQEWIPFFAFFLFKFFEKFEFKYFSLTAFFALLIALTEHQLLAFTVIFAVVFLIYQLSVNRKLLKSTKLLAYAGAGILLLAFFIFAFFLPFLRVATSGNNFLDAGIKQAQRYSMSFADPLVPAPSQTFWPGIHDWAISGNAGEKGSSEFVGYSTLLLAIFGLWVIFSRKGDKEATKGGKRRQAVIFWLISLVVFYIFALGPTMKYGSATVYLPYNLIYKYVPFYENIRTTGRFFIYGILSISMLAAFGYGYFEEKFKNKNYILTISCIVILVEFLALPIPETTLAYSPFYDQVAKQSGNFKLLEIPGSTSYDFASYEMMTNEVHSKAVVNGMALARVIHGQFDFQKSTPLLADLLYTTPADPSVTNDVITDTFFDQSTSILNYYGIRYITVQKQFVDPIKITKVANLVENNVAIQSKYEDNFLIAYEVKQQAPSGFYATIVDPGNLWSKAVNDKRNVFQHKTIASGAPITFVNMGSSPLTATMTLQMKSSAAQTVQIVAQSGEVLSTFSLGSDWQNYTAQIPLAVGSSQITFKLLGDNSAQGAQIKSISF